MDCGAARAAWQDADDEPLDAALTAQLEVHWQSCAACQRFVHQMRALDHAFTALQIESDVAAAGRNAAPALHCALKLRRAAPFTRAGWFAAAAAVLLAVGTSDFYSRTPRPPSHPTFVQRGGPQTGANLPGTDSDMNPLEKDSGATRVVLTGVSADDFLLVSEKSSNPRVHIYRLHSVYRVPTHDATATRALVAAGEPAEAGS